MKIQLSHKFEDIICLENLLEAWKEFLDGKRNKKDIQEFSLHLMDNIFLLHSDLFNHTYKHGGYQAFKINDPKPRDIHKAEVRDRLLHHAIYRILYPFFDKIFIADSYSCRNNKGTHKAVIRLSYFIGKACKNNTEECWVLKCDIRKFFASIDHDILFNVLVKYIPDKNILWLLEKIIFSFNSLCPVVGAYCNTPLPLYGDNFNVKSKIGLPLGNLTSQLFVNVYMNEFDQFIKHKLKIKKYIRYADDFIIIDSSYKYLKRSIKPIRYFLKIKLNLELHPQKIEIKKFKQGIDFLGYVILPHYLVLRTKTKKRMFKKIKLNREKLNQNIITKKSFNQSLQSYYGMLKHCCGHKIKININKIY
ncbi:MAG: reverse transcriptase/maturase family protein [bacterium]